MKKSLAVAIRVDASDQIGTGHLMRCLTLADALRVRGAKVHFVSRHMPLHLQQILRDHGHQFTLLAESHEGLTDELAHARWLGTSQICDAQATTAAMAGQEWDCLIVDHYALDTRWEKALRHVVKRIMVIDDIADRRHDCDVLLDQNLYADMEQRYIDKTPVDCRLLLGPYYALLRDEFRQRRSQVKTRSLPVKRILVFLGGVDVENYTMLAINALAGIDRRNFQVDVVIGAQHPAREAIEAACVHHDFACHIQTKRMAELMMSADLAIGAGGSASWERCCLGLPALLVSLAENQVDIARALDSVGACIYVGTQDTASVSVVRSAVVKLLNNEADLAALSEKAYSLVDGQGVDRLTQELCG